MNSRTASGAPLRIVFVGCGEISSWWFNSLKTCAGIEIVGLVDLDEKMAVKRKEEFALAAANIGTDLSAILAELRPDIVFDCTVPVARASVVETALRHGCHVLSEKPMANSMAEARHLMEVARTAGRTFAIMQNRRYQRSIRTLGAFLAANSLGELNTLNCDFYIGAHFEGYRPKMQHPLLLDMAIHSFDQARFLSGADPVSVYCREWNPNNSWYAQGASAAAIFQMSNGLVHIYRGSWCAEGLNTTWECDWRAIGSGGTATWDGANKMQAARPDKKEGFIHPTVDVPIPSVEWKGEEGHGGCIHHFLDCIRTGRTPETDCSDNIKSLAMVFAAIESAETDRPVAIEP